MKKILVLLLLISLITNVFYVGNAVSIGEVWDTLMGNTNDPILNEIVFHYRLPKAIAAIICGSALSTAGLLMQTLFRNPLAGPDVLGISAGATLGVATLTMSTSLVGFIAGAWTMGLAAIAGALLIMLVVLYIATRIPHATTLLIIGLMAGYFIGSAVSLLQSLASPDTLKLFTTWTFGSLSSIDEEQLLILAGFSLLCIMPMMKIARTLDIMQLGDDSAALLGINVKRTRILMIVSASLLTGIVTAFAGPISFIGITMPHLARGLTHSAIHKHLFPVSCLLGSILLLICNFIAELPMQPLPLNAVTSVFGAPILIYVLLKSNHR